MRRNEKKLEQQMRENESQQKGEKKCNRRHSVVQHIHCRRQYARNKHATFVLFSFCDEKFEEKKNTQICKTHGNGIFSSSVSFPSNKYTLNSFRVVKLHGKRS